MRSARECFRAFGRVVLRRDELIERRAEVFLGEKFAQRRGSEYYFDARV